MPSNTGKNIPFLEKVILHPGKDPHLSKGTFLTIATLTSKGCVGELGERNVVGEMAALDPEPRSASVSALDDSLLLKLTSEDLDLLMSEDVEVARGIIQTLCRRLRSVRNASSSGSNLEESRT